MLPETLEEFLRKTNGLSFDGDSIVISSQEIMDETDAMRRIENTAPNDPSRENYLHPLIPRPAVGIKDVSGETKGGATLGVN